MVNWITVKVKLQHQDVTEMVSYGSEMRWTCSFFQTVKTETFKTATTSLCVWSHSPVLCNTRVIEMSQSSANAKVFGWIFGSAWQHVTIRPNFGKNLASFVAAFVAFCLYLLLVTTLHYIRL